MLVRFRTHTGHYLKVEEHNDGLLVATTKDLGAAAAFRMDKKEGRGRVTLRHQGKFLSAEKGGGRGLRCNRPTDNAWEQFEIQPAAGGGDQVFIKGPGNNFVCAGGGGGGGVTCNRKAAGKWETFLILQAQDDARMTPMQYACPEDFPPPPPQQQQFFQQQPQVIVVQQQQPLLPSPYMTSPQSQPPPESSPRPSSSSSASAPLEEDDDDIDLGIYIDPTLDRDTRAAHEHISKFLGRVAKFDNHLLDLLNPKSYDKDYQRRNNSKKREIRLNRDEKNEILGRINRLTGRFNLFIFDWNKKASQLPERDFGRICLLLSNFMEHLSQFRAALVKSGTLDEALQKLLETFQATNKLTRHVAEVAAANDPTLDDAISALDSEIAQASQAGHDLEQQVAALKKKGNAAALEERLRVLEANQEQLQRLQQDKIEAEALRQVFEQAPQVWTFYRSCHVKLEELFLGIKAVASGVASNNLESTLGKVGGGIALAGEVLGLVPMVGDLGGFLVEKAGEAAKKVDQARLDNLLKTFSRLGTLDEFKQVAERVARHLSKRYCNQLAQLRTLDAEAEALKANQRAGSLSQRLKAKLQGMKQDAASSMLREELLAPAATLAEFCVAQMLERIQDGLDGPKVEEKLLQVVCVAPTTGSRGGGMGRAVAKKLSRNTLVTQHGVSWFLGDAFQRCGIETASGQFVVSGSKMDPANYGYARGTDDEVAQRAMISSKEVPRFVPKFPLRSGEDAGRRAQSSSSGVSGLLKKSPRALQKLGGAVGSALKRSAKSTGDLAASSSISLSFKCSGCGAEVVGQCQECAECGEKMCDKCKSTEHLCKACAVTMQHVVPEQTEKKVAVQRSRDTITARSTTRKAPPLPPKKITSSKTLPLLPRVKTAEQRDGDEEHARSANLPETGSRSGVRASTLGRASAPEPGDCHSTERKSPRLKALPVPPPSSLSSSGGRVSPRPRATEKKAASKDVPEWSLDDVCAHFLSLGAQERHLEGLREDLIDGEALEVLTKEDLKDDLRLPLGVVRKHLAFMSRRGTGAEEKDAL